MLQKPYDINIRGRTIDGNEVNSIRWKISGGVTVAFNIEIIDNADNSPVYALGRTNSYSTSFSLPPGTLYNGKEYKLRIQTWSESNQNIYSDYEIFQTSSRPVISLDPIGQLNSQANNFIAHYYQAENVSMRSHVFYLYNSDKGLINQSDIKTDSVIEYLFSNLQSEQNYYIEVQATSSKGLVGTTGKVNFSVLYTQPQMNVTLEAENVENAGIRLKWKTIQIIGESDCEELTFIDNEKLDLTNGCIVTFDEGFSLEKNGTMKFWIENPLYNINLFEMRGSNGTISMQYWEDNKFHVFKTINNIVSHYASSPVIGVAFFVCIQQIYDDLNVISEVISIE